MTITSARAVEASQSTLKTYLRPIDREGLLAFAEKGRNNPTSCLLYTSDAADE